MAPPETIAEIVLTRLTPKDEGPPSSRSDDIHRTVAVEIYSGEHGADARAVVDQLWLEPRASWRTLIPNRVVNVQDRSTPRIGIDDAVLREPTLPSNEIGNAVSIHIGK